MLILLKFVCLVVGLSYGFSNMAKILAMFKTGKLKISTFQLFAMTLGIVGFVFLQFKLYL